MLDEVQTDFIDPAWQVFMEAAETDKLRLEWEDKTQIRFGAEYRMDNLAFRAGYYLDPTPSPDETMNVLVPNYDFNVFTFGISYVRNGFEVDFAFEYLRGKDRNIPVNLVNQMPGFYSMNIISPFTSVKYGWQ